MKNKLDNYIIKGGKKLFGEVYVQTSKNASLPIISASLLTTDKVRIKDCPDILDVKNMILMLQKLGVKINNDDKDIIIDSSNLNNVNLDCKLTKAMRSSIFLLGSLLHRFGTIMINTPGGCKIGARPIDIHVDAFKKLGVKVVCMGDCLFFDASKARAGKIHLKLPSVGATENIVQFACLLRGKTQIFNAAKEPEVVDLCNFLSLMGAKILGAGTNKITIYGVDRLHGVEYSPIGDRIVAGTLMVAVALTGGKLALKNVNAHQNEKLIDILRRMGCQINIKHGIIKISNSNRLSSIDVSTGYYPDFPTDLQSMLLVLMCLADGESRLRENVFENRFLIKDELIKMGAKIQQIDNRNVLVEGQSELTGCTVRAKDLRGGASLVLAGLVAQGETRVADIHYIDRGYDHLENVLSSLGADIKRK